MILIVLALLCMPAFAQTTAIDWNNKGDALRSQGKLDEAIQAYDKAIDINPQYAEAWNGKGLVFEVQGKYDEAVNEYDKAIDIDPQFIFAWNNKGDALNKLGLTREANAAYAKAKELRSGGSTSSGTTTISPNATSTYILDHSIASNVDESTYHVVTRTNKFLSTDSKVYSWLSLGNVGASTVYWHWYSPDGNLFKTISVDIPSNTSGGYWSSYNVWSSFDIAGDIADLPGNWHADVYLNGKKLLMEKFTLESNAISTSSTTGNHILDHSMANNVDESTDHVIARTNKFLSTDSKVYSWLSLGNVGASTVEWHWYSPDGNLYKTVSLDIPPNPSGGHWSSYHIWSYLNIAGDIPADLPGNWHVDVYLDSQKLLTKQFTLATPLNDAVDWYNKGVVLHDQGKYDEAIQAYNKAIEIDPQYAHAWDNKGAALGAQGKYNEAIQAYDKAIEINPQYADAWSNKGVVLDDLGKYDETLKACNEAIRLDPYSADSWYNKGNALKAQKKYDEAIQAYNKAIEIDPQYAKAWGNKGTALGAQGKYDEAIQVYDKAIEINPQDAGAWNNKGVALDDQGKHDEAIQAYDKAIEINPQYADAWSNKGVALNDQGKYDEAIQAYDHAIQLNSGNGLYWSNKGYALKALGRTIEAEKAYAKAKELGYGGGTTTISPNAAPSTNILTVCPRGCGFTSIQAAIYAAHPNDTIEVHSGTYNESVILTKDIRFTGIDTGSGEPIVNGDLYQNDYTSDLHDFSFQSISSGIPTSKNMTTPNTTLYWIERAFENPSTSKAIEALDQIIKTNPKDAWAWYEKGWVLHGSGKYDESLSAYNESIKLDPYFCAPWNEKGDDFYSLKKYGNALEAYEKAIQLEPNAGLYWSNKSYALEKLGRTSEANEAYAKAEDLGYWD